MRSPPTQTRLIAVTACQVAATTWSFDRAFWRRDRDRGPADRPSGEARSAGILAGFFSTTITSGACAPADVSVGPARGTAIFAAPARRRVQRRGATAISGATDASLVSTAVAAGSRFLRASFSPSGRFLRLWPRHGARGLQVLRGETVFPPPSASQIADNGGMLSRTSAKTSAEAGLICSSAGRGGAVRPN